MINIASHNVNNQSICRTQSNIYDETFHEIVKGLQQTALS